MAARGMKRRTLDRDHCAQPEMIRWAAPTASIPHRNHLDEGQPLKNRRPRRVRGEALIFLDRRVSSTAESNQNA
jgi:hypothetical protein